MGDGILGVGIDPILDDHSNFDVENMPRGRVSAPRILRGLQALSEGCAISHDSWGVLMRGSKMIER